MSQYNDSHRQQGLRSKLIKTLIGKGIKQPELLDAMGKLPRHYFMDRAFDILAYEDKAMPIGAEQTISQPFTVAFMTELLEVKKRDTVLEIGTGSGYQSAILSMLGATVYTIERHESLHKQTKLLFAELGFKAIKCFLKDGYKGLTEFAPFDKIIITAACDEIPNALKLQLRIGGILVAPVGIGSQTMTKLVRVSEENFTQETFGEFRFVPMLDGIRN